MIEINPASREWLLIKAWAEERLVTHRTTLESFALMETQSNAVRGRIAELKSLLKLGEPPRKTAMIE